MTSTKVWTLLFILLAGCLFGGCQSVTMTADPQLPYPPKRKPEPGDVFHIPTGTFLSPDRFVDVLADSRIVYIGESHDNVVGHRAEAEILRALAHRHPGQVALGMEMFVPAQQDALDRWVAGELGEKAFLKESRWYDNWRMDFDYYRDLLLTARDMGIPVVGLNAPKDVLHKVGRMEDWEPPGEEGGILEMDMTDPYHAALVDAVYGGHDHGKKSLETFRRVQVLWDETMAENIVRYLSAPGNEEMRMVVVAGGNHIRNGFGIPRRVFRRFPSVYVTVGLEEVSGKKGLDKARLMDVTIPDFPMPKYDFYVYLGFEELEKKGVKLGILMDESDGRILVREILPGSAAAKAGLLRGDALITFGGLPLAGSADLLLELRERNSGDTVSVNVERQGEEKALEVTFP